MKFLSFLVPTLAWGIVVIDGIDINYNMDTLQPVTTSWTIKADYRTDLQCHLKCDLEGKEFDKDVLYIGTFDSTINVFDWNVGTQKYVKRTTLKTIGVVYELLIDKTRNRLIALTSGTAVGPAITMFYMSTSPIRVSKPVKTKLYYGSKLHASGNFLMASGLNDYGRVTVLQLNNDDNYTSVFTYTPDPLETKGIKMEFHPISHSVLAVTYPSLKKIVFFRFDTLKKSLKVIAELVDEDLPNNLLFSVDGNYLYVTCHNFKLYTYKIDATNFAVKVGLKIGSVTLLREPIDRYSKISTVMAVTRSQRFLYVIQNAAGYFSVFRISPSTHEPLTNGFYNTSTTSTYKIVISSDDRQLLVHEPDLAIFTLNIRRDGLLAKGGTIKDVTVSTVMLLVTE